METDSLQNPESVGFSWDPTDRPSGKLRVTSPATLSIHSSGSQASQEMIQKPLPLFSGETSTIDI